MAEKWTLPYSSAESPRLLFTPSYLSYLLCGVARNEYSMASTSGLLNARTCGWNRAVLQAAGIPIGMLGATPALSGTPLGFLSADVAAAVGYSCKVVLTASHDTASAYLATPLSAGNPAILSSGTWSLLGMELDKPITTEAARHAGFTNERGHDAKILFLRNITGLWILQAIRREWNRRLSYTEMAEMALNGKDYLPVFDASDERFLAPACMSEEILAALSQSGAPAPANDAQLLYCIHHSLARCYQVAVDHLSHLTGRPVTAIHVVGGGCQNRTLNQLTADCTGLTVYAGPVEATALGNLAVQWIAVKQLGDVAQARRMIQNSVQPEVYSPHPIADRELSV
jgi:rhamnulokinase